MSEKSNLQKALDSFEERLGVTYEELSKDKTAQAKARKVLDKKTEELRNKFNKENNMIEISLKELVNNLLDHKKYKTIQVLDLDGEYHIVSSIDIIRERISCTDGFYQYFDAFDYSEEEYHKLFVI